MTLKQVLQLFIDKYQPFRIAVACSGGSDSMALCFGLQSLGIKFQVLIVDHKLREESTKEALHVQKKLQKQGIPVKILTWDHTYPIIKNIQHKARKARYALLDQTCYEYEITHLLTAHHFDDQMETIAMRRIRSRSLYGLQGMKEITYTPHYALCRPLLQLKKQQLLEVLKSNHSFYVNDPSNDNEAFERVRIRKQLKDIKIFKDCSNSIKSYHYYAHLIKKSSLLQRWVKNDLDDSVYIPFSYIFGRDSYKSGYVFLGSIWLKEESKYLLNVTMMRTLLWGLSGKPYPPSYRKTIKMIAVIKEMKAGKSFCIAGVCVSYTVSIHHSEMSHHKKGFLLYRDNLPTSFQYKGKYGDRYHYIWNDRFQMQSLKKQNFDAKGIKIDYPYKINKWILMPNFENYVSITWQSHHRLFDH